jgi:hypothetical protein
MGEFRRDLLPEPIEYYEQQGHTLKGRGKWRTTHCEFHGGSDSMRVNVESGGFRCMNCSVKGGDVLAHYMQTHGWDFVNAARALGAYIDDGKPHRGTRKPWDFSYRSACEVVRKQSLLLAMIGCKAVRGTATEADRDAGLQAAADIEKVMAGVLD